MKASEILDEMIKQSYTIAHPNVDDKEFLISRELYDQLCDEAGMICISYYKGRKINIL